MESTNRSGLQCYEHPREQITNFCINVECLKPLCPDCVQIHTKIHHKQEILSWKHCLSESAMKMKSTLDELRILYEAHRQLKGPKSIESVEAENIQRLNNLRDKYHRMVDEVFNAHEAALRVQVRQAYRFDQPDTSKLKVAIEEIQKLLMKLAHPSSAVPALKKSILLDQRSLLDFFGHLRNPRPAIAHEHFFTQSSSSLAAARSAFERSITLELITEPAIKPVSNYAQRRFSNHMSVGEWEDPFQPLRISLNDYYRAESHFKTLHFFIPCSFELKIIDLEAPRQNWQTISFKAQRQLPCYFKSISTPNGDIYLTGGSQEERRCREIFRFNKERNSLDFVANMTLQRSSHSICYLDNKIYLVGGFSGVDGDVTRQCEVYDLQSRTCTKIAPLNTPSANSAATPFAGQFIFKFGGILNKSQGNSLIQMYSVKSNRWIVVNIESPRAIPPLELLSFSAAVQVNDRDILVFGGYDNSQLQKPERVCYALSVWPQKNTVRVKNYNTNPLVNSEGFWNNNPIIFNRCVYALQNITDEQDDLTALADERRVVVFNGERWL